MKYYMGGVKQQGAVSHMCYDVDYLACTYVSCALGTLTSN
jgi:hypothetical protein